MTTDKTVWYHGTASGLIRDFRPFTHFGDLVAAKYACAMKVHGPFADDSEKEPIIIEVRIMVRQHELYVSSDDWGTPNAAGLALVIESDKSFPAEVRAEATAIRERICELSRAERHVGYVWVKKLYDQLGIRAISYENKVENTNGELSICVVDPSAISVVRSFGTPADELEKIYTNTPLAKSIAKF